MPPLLGLYHRLPYPLRVMVASVRGYHLRWWRYNAETERIAEEALERETWSPQRWHAYQEDVLARILHRAATRVPYYRDHWQRRRRAGDGASWEVLDHWPLLTKEVLRERPSAFVADDCDPRAMFSEHTSGTSGKPLQLWFRRETVQRWYALYEARVRGWNGVSRHDRWALFGGQLVAPFAQETPPFWVWNAGLRQLYLSSYHLAPEHAGAYLAALREHGVTYLLGYPSAMYALAQVARESGLAAPALRVAISNAEPLLPHQRHAVAEVFQCPVRNTYGMSEIVCMATECDAGTLHLWPDVGILEVWRDEAPEPVADGEDGRLVCTGLLNPDMPLIRYQVGDRGRLAAPGARCGCGRSLPVLQSIEGRLDDVVLTRDGRRVGRLDPVFKADLPIREAQIIQETRDTIRVCFVPADGYQAQHGALIAARLRDRVGDMEVVLEPVASIPRTANGKLRSVISKVSST